MTGNLMSFDVRGYLVAYAFILIFVATYLDKACAVRATNKGNSESSEVPVESETHGGLNLVRPANHTNERKEPQESDRGYLIPNTASLRSFNFDVVDLDSSGNVVAKRKVQAQYHTEVLLGGTTLEMIKIPAGTFLMGTSYAEAEDVVAEYRRHLGDDGRLKQYGSESVATQIPQHTVSVQAFFIGKFEVTQAQWRAVARTRKVKRDLVTDPSFFKGDDLPVEEVTWEDAKEFCDRLSRETGKEYRLPSEAEWEYACRAGTVTQFHLGDTITPEFVNYNGDYPYGSGMKGMNRKQTTRVGSLGAANAFGLFDMHGNVEEWCMDPWHENYDGAPSDGRIWVSSAGDSWIASGENLRVVRGGSWLQIPCYNRAANRAKRWQTNNKNYFTGLRVVCK